MKQEERTARTRSAIIDAYWSIYTEDTAKDITVKEVADRAGINRSTVYLYFGSTSEILDAVKGDLVAHWKSVFTEDVDDLTELFTRMEVFVSDYGGKLFYLVGPNGDPGFPDILKEMVMYSLNGVLKVPVTEQYRLTVEFMASGIIGVVRSEYAQYGRIRREVVSKLVRIWLTEGVLFGIRGEDDRIGEVIAALKDEYAD